MLRFSIFVLVCVLFALGCGGSAPSLPLSARAFAEGEPTLVWVGRGEAERYEDGVWSRTPSFDYDFLVLQRRHADHWESIKEMHRRHPEYDESAGPRDQTYHFRIDLPAAVSGAGPFPLEVRSTLGDGSGTTDAEFRRALLTIRADVSSMALFDTYRITQDYRYEDAVLNETVELFEAGSPETPWVRNTEHAVLYAVHHFDGAPTRLTNAPQPPR
jgi:hypothetical protein